MFEQNQNFEESEDIKEIDESSEDLDTDSTELSNSSTAKEIFATTSDSGSSKGLVARKILEEYREERALRKAIYDDLYGYDEEE